MDSTTRFDEYLREIRERVCSHCIERPPGGPPCQPLGKRCGIELNLPRLIEAVHAAAGQSIEPYIDSLHDEVCAVCTNRTSDQCPCPLEYLITLAVEAIEAVDQRCEET